MQISWIIVLSTSIMKNCVHWNHITLQLKLKKQLIYNYYIFIS
jgi:hypothetical protein